jgi:hypothetical protein
MGQRICDMGIWDMGCVWIHPPIGSVDPLAFFGTLGVIGSNQWSSWGKTRFLLDLPVPVDERRLGWNAES